MNIENVASYQGTYSGATSYSQGDIVTYNGASYLSLVNSNTGNQPDSNPSDWVVLGITTPAPHMYHAYGPSASLSLPAGTYRIDAMGDTNSIGISGTYTWVQDAPTNLGSLYSFIITLSSTQTISLTGCNTYGLLFAYPLS